MKANYEQAKKLVLLISKILNFCVLIRNKVEKNVVLPLDILKHVSHFTV